MDRREFLKTTAGAVAAGAAAPMVDTVAAQRRDGPFAADGLGRQGDHRCRPPRAGGLHPRSARFRAALRRGLTARSVSQRSRPVEVTDFTRGTWRTLPLDLVRA